MLKYGKVYVEATEEALPKLRERLTPETRAAAKSRFEERVFKAPQDESTPPPADGNEALAQSSARRARR